MLQTAVPRCGKGSCSAYRRQHKHFNLQPIGSEDIQTPRGTSRVRTRDLLPIYPGQSFERTWHATGAKRYVNFLYQSISLVIAPQHLPVLTFLSSSTFANTTHLPVSGPDSPKRCRIVCSIVYQARFKSFPSE